MRHCYVSFYFCCYNRCQQAPSRGSPPPPYESSTRPLLQSCYSLQLGSICSPIPPLPLILVLILLLPSSCSFCFCFCSSRLCLNCPTRFPTEIPRPPLSLKKALDLSDSRQRPGRLCAFETPFSAIARESEGVSPQATSPVHRFASGLILIYIISFFTFSSPFLLVLYLGPTSNYLPGVFGSHKASRFFLVYFGLSLAEEIFFPGIAPMSYNSMPSLQCRRNNDLYNLKGTF